jgi:hypothetical protein
MNLFHAAISDEALVARLSKLWPHRLHESSAVKNLFCHCGLHRWMRLGSVELVPGREVKFCYWCDKVKLDGTIYDG